jgi:hypothetical protein
MQGIALSEGDFRAIDASTLQFPPTVLTLLDVVEHFPVEGFTSRLARLFDTLRPTLKWVVIKVPVSDGMLFRTASIASRVGLHGPLHQLFQVGTTPPHRHYFSRGSLRLLTERLGLQMVELLADPDFEPEALADRIHLLRSAPRPAKAALRTAFAALDRVRPDSLCDSAIVVAGIDHAAHTANSTRRLGGSEFLT